MAVNSSRSLVVIGAYLALCSCSTLPSFDGALGPSNAAPTVPQLVTHIQCEIKDAIEDPNPELDGLRKNIYIVYANLTLDVTDSQGLTPTVSFIHPFSVTGTNLTGSINGQLTGEQHRNINQTFTLDLDPAPENSEISTTCDNDRGKLFGLKGNLRIKEIIIAGLKHASSADFIFPLPSPTDSSGQALALSPSLVPNFGSTIDFTVVYGLGGGPTWTLIHFTGPGSGLLNFTRTDKDTLVLSFASAGPRVVAPLPAAIRPPGGLSDIELAAKAAQDNATRMILQRLLPVP